VLVRIARQELEAWYFGELDALGEVFQGDDLRVLSTRVRFRDPDGIDQPARTLAEVVDEFQKVSGARRKAEHLSRNNRSRSYQVLIEGIERLQETMLSDAPSGGGVGTPPVVAETSARVARPVPAHPLLSGLAAFPGRCAQ
jgi:hypothetical protein